MYFYHLFILMVTLHASFSSRRITDGQEVTENKKYAVYFLKAPKAEVKYTGWTCGGAIVTEWFIITAASCVEDIPYLYAIAGYNKYINEKDVDVDECTRAKKKKVILTCVPKDYTFSYKNINQWSRIDIAIVKVESPYNFEDSSYARICSYTPAPIIINYEPRYQQPGLDAIVMGWGHSKFWRKPKDLSVYNAPTLRYASTRIMNKDECKHYYNEVEGMANIITDYMICTLEAGNLDDAGEVIEKSKPEATGCLSQVEKLMGIKGSVCDLSSSEIIAVRSGIDTDPTAISRIRSRKSGTDETTDKPAVNKNETRRKKEHINRMAGLWYPESTKTDPPGNYEYADLQEDEEANYSEHRKGNLPSEANGANGGQPNGANGGQPYGANDEQPNGANGEQPNSANGGPPEGANGGQPNGANSGQPNGANGGQPNGANGGKPNGTNGRRPNGANGGQPNGANGGQPNGGQSDYDASDTDQSDNDPNVTPETVMLDPSIPNYHTSLKADPTPGLCQNDHGSPLVSWVGAHEVLLGVASVFKIDENRHCVGPYLFTSTQCNGRFLECILNMYSNSTSLRRNCQNELRRDGITMIERRLSWVGHPAGPAENELIKERVQQPLHQYHG